MLLDRLQDCKRVVRRKQYLRAAARKERIVKDRGSVGQWSDDEMDWRLIELEQGINRRDDGFERSVRVYGALRFAGGAAGTGYRDSVLHRSEEHTSELQSLMRNSYAVFCLKKKNTQYNTNNI